MTSSLNPMVDTPDRQPNIFADLDPKTIDFPDQTSPLETSYHQTVGLDPDHAATVMKTAQATNQPPEFVEGNMDAARKAAEIPPSEYFSGITKKYPATAKYLSDPANMAPAKDDIGSLTDFEQAVSGAVRAAANFVPGVFEKNLAEATPAMADDVSRGLDSEKSALQSGILQEQRDFLGAGKIIGQNMDSGSLTGHVFNRITGVSGGQDVDQRLAVINQKLAELEKNRPAPQGVSGVIKRGIYGATEFVPWMTGEAVRGAEYALPLGLMGAAAGSETGPGAAVPAAIGAGTGFTIGAGEYNFWRMAGMMRNQMDALKDNDGKPLPENIKNIASLASGAIGTGLGMIRFGAIMKTIPGGQEFLDGLTKAAGKEILNPTTYKSALADYTKQWLGTTAQAAGVMGALTASSIGIQQAAEGVSGQKFPSFSMKQAIAQTLAATGEGALTFGVLGIPGTAMGMSQTALEVNRNEQMKEAYLAMGDAAEGSKLRARLPDAYREFVDQATKGSPVENINIPAAAFDTYFQSKKIDPDETAKELGVYQQMPLARESGGDVSIPLSVWADKMIGTEHYDGLKDDIRFHPEDLTTNERKEASDVAGQQIQEAADQAVKDNPGIEAGRDFVYNELKTQLAVTGQLDPKMVDADAKLGAAAITRLAAMHNMDPKDYFQQGSPLRVAEAAAPISPADKASSELEQGTMFQGDPEVDPRGFIKFTPKETLIGLVKADASTFPHELAHYWLKNFHEFIQTGQGTEQHAADWKTLSDWLKVADDQKALTVDQQEKFARGFEAYLREGKSPSEELKGVFTKFRRWLTRLYRDPISLGVELNDNVRGVMSRMIASEDEIAFAEQSAGITDGKEYDKVDLDPKVRAKLDNLRSRAHEQAVKKLLDVQLSEMDEKHQKMLAEERVKARIDAETAISTSPLHTAMDALGKTFKEDPLKAAQRFWLGKMEPGERDQFDQLAEARGFSSGDELAKRIVHEPSEESQVADAISQHMAQFADLRNRDEIKDEAMKAVHGEKSTELMALESGVLRNLVSEANIKAQAQQGLATERRMESAEEKIKERELATPWRTLQERARIEAEAAKLKAQALVDSKPVAEAGRFMAYFTAERNAAVRVKKALSDGDYAEAADAKRKQMLNHALAAESYRARAEIGKTLNFFNRFINRKQDLKGISYGFIRQIDSLMEMHGLSEPRQEDAQTYLTIAKTMAEKGEYPDQIAQDTGYIRDEAGQWKPETITDTVQRIQNDYRNVAIPDSVLTGGESDYKQMKMGEFRDLKQAVQAINAVGRGYDRFLDENIKMDRREAAAKLRAFVEGNIGAGYAEQRDIGTKPGENWFTTKWNSIKSLPDAAIPSLVNLLSICDFLDKGEPDGLMKNLVYRPLLHGEQGAIRMTDAAIGDMNKILDFHFADGEYERLKKDKVYIASRDRSMTRDEIMAVALNWGNATNRQRVIDGYKLTDPQIREILSNVSKRDWDFAQAIWDHNDKYWPEIVALQQKVAGETPGRVNPSVVSTPHGDYRGGYYPISYDYTRSSEAYNNLEARNALYKTAGAVAAHTEHGFTSGRVTNFTGPIRLDTNVIFNHLQDVIHDLNYRKNVVDVNGFLRQRDTREALINAIGLDGFRTIEQHLKWVASDQGEYLTAADKILRQIRFGATIATLGLRPVTGPIFLASNIINATQDLGPVGFGNSVKDFLGDRDANVQFVNDNSARMTHRATLRDRDLADMAKRWTGEDSLIQHYMFYVHNKADQAITYPLWLQTYRGAVNEFGHQKAVDIADEAVTKLAGSGSMLDQSMIQRGSESKKVFTWWYSWAGMMFNRAWREGKFAGLEYDKGNVGTALTITAQAALYGWVLQGANENLWREAFRNSPEVDPDKQKKRVAMRMAMQGISYLPIFREMAQYGMERASGQQTDMKLPFQEAVQTMINPLADMAHSQIEDKQMSPRFWEDTAKVAAIVGHYPQMLNTWAFNFNDYLNDQGELTWRDMLTRRTKS